ADRRGRATAHEMLAKIALARRDAEAARAEAALARDADPPLPLPAYVEGRLLYDQGRYADAVPLFTDAAAALKKNAAAALKKNGPQVFELHFYAADTLSRLGRYDEAQAEFLEELKWFPQNTRARAGLALA